MASCMYCGSESDDGSNFCSSECLQKYDKEYANSEDGE